MSMVEVKLKYLGHASFQVEFDGKIIYIDPYAGEYVEKADLILITHSHRDHCDPEKIEAVTKEGTLIYGPSACEAIVRNLRVIRSGDKFDFNNAVIEAVPAYNVRRFRSPGLPFHPKEFGVGYLITIGDRTLYHAGDTDFIPEMRQLQNIHAAMLPIGGTYTMDVEEAVQAAIAIKPKIAIPMHIRDENPLEFKEKVEAKSNVEVVVLKPGSELKL